MKRFLLPFLLIFSACSVVPLNPNYKGPEERPTQVAAYYKQGGYSAVKEFSLGHSDDYEVKRLILTTESGEVTIDFFERKEKNDNLIFVFPMLGGKNMIPNYFATYFAKRGFDTAIVHRNEDFKNPENFQKIEEILKRNVLRDRIAIDFFEREKGKKNFGSFGLSRGAINVAITAAVDDRLKYNVLALGGSDLPDMFKHAKVKKLKNYRQKIMDANHISEEEFFDHLEKTVKTDPKYLAQYINAKNTLMFLSMFDSTVPIKNGLELKEKIGNPRTVFLAADHFTVAAYTQLGRVLPIGDSGAILPLDYVESESLDFYRSKFNKDKFRPEIIPYRVLQLPFNIIQKVTSVFL